MLFLDNQNSNTTRSCCGVIVRVYAITDGSLGAGRKGGRTCTKNIQIYSHLVFLIKRIIIRIKKIWKRCDDTYHTIRIWYTYGMNWWHRFLVNIILFDLRIRTNWNKNSSRATRAHCIWQKDHSTSNTSSPLVKKRTKLWWRFYGIAPLFVLCIFIYMRCSASISPEPHRELSNCALHSTIYKYPFGAALSGRDAHNIDHVTGLRRTLGPDGNNNNNGYYMASRIPV